MPEAQYYSVGKIHNFFGTQGFAKIKVQEGRAKAFAQLDEVLVENESGVRVPLHIDSVQIAKDNLIVKFREFNSINDVEQYKKCILYASRKTVKKTLKPGEFLVSDLIGMKVCDKNGKKLGFIENVLPRKAQDILSVQGENGKTFLVPFVDELVPEVNVEDKVVILNPIEGLI